MGLAEVSSILWREREMLELLLFKLEEEQLVLASGRSRWLSRTTREVDMVLDQIRRTELMRAAEVDSVASDLGLVANPSLKALCEAAKEPWKGILTSHRQAFMTLTAEISSLATANRDLLTTGQRNAHETLLSLTDGLQTYSPAGAAVDSTVGGRLVDEAI